MSEEDAFLDGIAADRADRTRLLVFADWLADRSDQREEFVRLHAKLLDMDGSERDYGDTETKWAKWAGGPWFDSVRRPQLTNRWLDSLCRICTTDEVEAYSESGLPSRHLRAVRTEYTPNDHSDPSEEVTLTLYHGAALNYDRPFVFVAETLLVNLWIDPFNARDPDTLDFCYPITRAMFWGQWDCSCGDLLSAPRRPEFGVDNCFLGAQWIKGNRSDWGMVATYQRDYFALIRSTTI